MDAPAATPYRLLIVDDTAAVREALRWALEGEHDLLVVAEADNGLDALAQALLWVPDVVLLDIELPHIDGYSVARSLKALPFPPVIIMLTIHSDRAARQAATAAGGDHFVEKGTGWPALIVQIREALPQHRALHKNRAG